MKYFIEPILINALRGETAVKIGINSSEEVGINYAATVTLFTEDNKAVESFVVEIKGEDYKQWTGNNETILQKITATQPLIKLTGDVEEDVKTQII